MFAYMCVAASMVSVCVHKVLVSMCIRFIGILRCFTGTLLQVVPEWRTEADAKSVTLDAAAIFADVQAGRLAEAQPIANLGGRHHTNCRRDFNRYLQTLDYGLEVLQCPVVVQNFLKLDEVQIDIPVYAPHEMLGALFEAGWSSFSKVLLGDVSEGYMI